MVQRQWASPGTGPSRSSSNRKFYNVGPELARVLQMLLVDGPVAALTSSSTILNDPEEALKAEDKRMEQTLLRAHQAATWAAKVSTAASLFNRTWLR